MTTTAREATRTTADRSYGGGLALALVSASSFGLSGSLARSLLDLGWSPAAVVATRVGGAFLILLLPSLSCSDGSDCRPVGSPLRMLAYGVVAIALAQLCYFSAVQYLSVGVALLLEYLAPVMLIGWHWARTQRRPAWPVLAGAGLSIVGLAFVLDLRTDSRSIRSASPGVWVRLCASARTSSSARTTGPMHRSTRCC